MFTYSRKNSAPIWGSEIGFGEKLIAQGIAKASGFEKEEVEKMFNKTGDLGNTAEEFIKKKQLSLKHKN